MARIIGESYYRTNRFKEAIPYLEKYMEKADYVTKEDKYQLAFAYYRSGNYEEAAGMFGRLSTGNSLICQNALYHLADCYLKLDKKQDARMAFSSASKQNFDQNIAEDALFNYAVLTYELSYNPFNEAIIALNDYIEKYPNSKRTDEAYNFLVLAYMNTKNYSMALASIEKIKNKTTEIKKSYQKIAFYRALELFNNLRYNESIKMLDQSLTYGEFDHKLALMVHYWKAEAFYRLDDYSSAIENYNRFLNQTGSYNLDEYDFAMYGIAYSFFSKNNITKLKPG
ncbi:MAG: tetratricopeptide repeat protein, partial [Bacteroidales bacterium]|nr:tetratricopeptide repeat protein [Bacteroidales bacterium]